MGHPTQAITESNLHCVQCGYDLSGSPVGGACPECGTPVQSSLNVGQGTTNAPNSIAALVFGILSLTVCGLLGPVAIGLYFSAKSNYERGNYARSSMTMAKAGMVCGIIACVLLALWVLAAGAGSL